MAINVLIPVANGSEEVETVCIFSALKRAGATVTIASVETSLQVITSRGLKITADRFIDECAEMTFDLIACPGGMPGARRDFFTARTLARLSSDLLSCV